MSSRDRILKTLRANRPDFSAHDSRAQAAERRDVAPVTDTAPAALLDLFTAQAEALQCIVTVCADEAAAIRALLDAIQPDTACMCWDFAAVPLPGLEAALSEAGIAVTHDPDPALRVGITGAEAAIAATGSLVIASGPGKARAISLLPDRHIAVIRAGQIVPTMEAWGAALLVDGPGALNVASNWVLVSGASRTADIAMELVLGAHGPRELQIVIVP